VVWCERLPGRHTTRDCIYSEWAIQLNHHASLYEIPLSFPLRPRNPAAVFTGLGLEQVVGAVEVVASAFAITIGCASRPASKVAFVTYLLWEIACLVMVLLVLGAVGDATTFQCEAAVSSAVATVPVSTELACPQLVEDATSIGEARVQCVNTLTQGLCEWSDKCVLEDELGCTGVTPAGTCEFVRGECRVADDTAPVRQTGNLDLWGACVFTLMFSRLQM
jgi:hypothetical protein